MKTKTINVLIWPFIIIGTIAQCVLCFSQIGILSDIATITFLAAIILTFISYFKDRERSVLEKAYDVCLMLGLAILTILVREFWVNASGLFGISILFHWIFGLEKGWDIGIYVYCVFLALTALILLIAFVGKLVLAIRKKAETGKMRKALLITGYAVFAAAVLLFSIAAGYSLLIQFEGNFIEIACILGLFAPIFIALVLAFLQIQKRAKTE